MSELDISLDDAREAKDEMQSGNLRENDAGIPEDLMPDYDEAVVIDDVQLAPEVLVIGSHIARISINDYGNVGDEESLFSLEQNLEGALVSTPQGMQPYGFKAEITIADPEIITGTLWEQDDTEYPDYKLVGDPEADTNPYEVRETVQRDDDGNVSGATTDGLGNLPGGNQFDASNVPLEADYLTIKLGGRRAREILGTLDTAGSWFTDPDGTVVEGLFEVPPEFGTDDYDGETHGYPRLTGYPELRVDMVDQQVAVHCEFDTDDPTEADTRTKIETAVMKVTDDGLVGLSPLTPEDDAYALPTYPRANNTYWTDSSGSTSDNVGADAEPETNGGMEEARNLMGDLDGGDDTTDETTYEDLTDGGKEFVDEGVSTLRSTEGFASTDDIPGDWEERVASADVDIQADAEDLARIIDERV